MNSENRDRPTTAQEFEFSGPPLIPPVKVAHVDAGDSDLSQWADERLAIYASLDAAMTRHIVEAISALSELKGQIEEDARRTSQQMIVERDQLKHEVEELRLEQVRLEDQLKESRRNYQEEEARRIGLEHSSAAWLEQARSERDELQLEIKRLKVQLEAGRSELQDFYRYRSEAIEDSGGFAAWLEKQSAPKAEPASLPKLFDFNTETPLQPFRLTTDEPKPAEPPSYGPEDLAEPHIPFDWEAFGDAPTPRVVGGSSVIARQVEAESINEVARQAAEFVDEPLVVEPIKETPAPTLAQVPAERTRDRVRRARTEQRIQHILGKRRPQVPKISPAADGGDPPPPDLVEPESSEVAQVASPVQRNKTAKKRPALGATDERAALKEIGAQLGLDPRTPPPVANIRFAPGYTPPAASNPLAQMLNDLRSNVDVVSAPQEAAPPRPSSVQLPPVTTSTDEELASFYGDYGVEDFGPMTLEELLEAGEQEIATINENPTPPDEPAPFIGDVGPDKAMRFHAEPITQPGQVREDKFILLSPENAPPASSKPPTTPDKANSSNRKKATDPLEFSAFPLPPPPASVRQTTDLKDTIITKLTVANVQGRFSPLLLEKVVRNLDDVNHVMVTDFSKGVLVMDVRHKPNFDLAAKLLSMTELHLRLVKQGKDSLEFADDNHNTG